MENNQMLKAAAVMWGGWATALSIAAITQPSEAAIVDYAAPALTWSYVWLLWRGDTALRWASWVVLVTLASAVAYSREFGALEVGVISFQVLVVAYSLQRSAYRPTAEVAPSGDEVLAAYSRALQQRRPTRLFDSEAALPFPKAVIRTALSSAKRDPIYSIRSDAIGVAERALATYVHPSKIEPTQRLFEAVHQLRTTSDDRWLQTLNSAPNAEREAVAAVVFADAEDLRQLRLRHQ